MNSEMLNTIGLGDVDIFYIFLTLVIAILILLILLVVQTITSANLKKRLRIFMSGRNAMSLENGIASIYKDISMLKEHDIRFRTDIKEIKTNLLDCYQKVGLVKYDAFREMGGQLSFSIALLDKQDNGFILNSVHSANGCYTYTKEIQNGVSAIELADEEKEALNRAMRFTGNIGVKTPKTDLNGQMYDRPSQVYENNRMDYGYNPDQNYYAPNNGYNVMDQEQGYYDDGSEADLLQDDRYNA